jgi:branched-subunit amino acid transport protein
MEAMMAASGQMAPENALGLTAMILGLEAGTFLLRIVPLAVLTRVSFPGWLERWLRLVPGAVLAASLAQTLLVREGTIDISVTNLSLLAAAPAFAIAWRTRSVVLTMLTGMAAYALLQNVIG